MSEISKQSQEVVNVLRAPVLVADGTLSESAARRRRLIRAGLSAAPVLLALKSQSVLAADICIKPSAFSSLVGANMKLSHKPNQGWTCFSHGYWKNHDHPAPYTNKAKSYFSKGPGSTCGTGAVCAGFADTSNTYQGKTLQDMLELQGGGLTALARHIVGTFLTAVANNDDITKVLLTTTQCKAIWASGGVWSPAAGINWSLQDTLNYFDYIYGGP